MSKIIEAPNPVLSGKAQAVRLPFPSDLPGILHQMEKALIQARDPKGVGLAAPQIGLSLRIFIAKPTDKSKIQVFINPKILKIYKTPDHGLKSKKAKKVKRIMEGCLSLPHYYGPIVRARKVNIEFLDEDGVKQKKTFSGLDSQIVLHEIDHLNGMLFVDRLLEQKKPLYEFIDGEWEKVEL